MNATLIGKILVFTNLVFSLMLAALAIGIVTNRMDWAPSPPESDGLHALKTAEIAQKKEAFVRSRLRWKGERDSLLVLEKKRPDDQKWYAEQLAIALTGLDRDDKPVA